MYCSNCGAQITDDTLYCPECGTKQEIVPDYNNQLQPDIVDAYPVPPAPPAPPISYGDPGMSYGTSANRSPALQLRTNRGLAKYFFLSIVTLGVYGITVDTHMSEEINLIASPHDGQRTTHKIIAGMLTVITFGVYALVWAHKYNARIGGEVVRRGYNYSFGAKDFWLWCILGSMIIVGPFIYKHKQFKAFNIIAQDYNNRG